MGRVIYDSGSEFFMLKENFKPAFSAIKKKLSKIDCFKDEIKKSKDLWEFFCNIGWGSDGGGCDDKDNRQHLMLMECLEKFENNIDIFDPVFDAIAPFVKKGSYLELWSYDRYNKEVKWRYVFDGIDVDIEFPVWPSDLKNKK